MPTRTSQVPSLAPSDGPITATPALSGPRQARASSIVRAVRPAASCVAGPLAQESEDAAHGNSRSMGAESIPPEAAPFVPPGPDSTGLAGPCRQQSGTGNGNGPRADPRHLASPAAPMEADSTHEHRRGNAGRDGGPVRGGRDRPPPGPVRGHPRRGQGEARAGVGASAASWRRARASRGGPSGDGAGAPLARHDGPRRPVRPIPRCPTSRAWRGSRRTSTSTTGRIRSARAST